MKCDVKNLLNPSQDARSNLNQSLSDRPHLDSSPVELSTMHLRSKTDGRGDRGNSELLRNTWQTFELVHSVLLLPLFERPCPEIPVATSQG